MTAFSRLEIYRKKASGILKFAILIPYSIIIGYPLLFVFFSSLKSNAEIFTKPWELPSKWSFEIYIDVWTKFSIGTYFLNSIYYTVISVVISVFISSLAAYALTRLKWKLKKFVYALILLGLMVPVHSQLVPLYIILTRLGITNPRITVIGIFVAFSIPISIYLLSQFIKGIPIEMEESAVIDGSGLIKAFFSIIIPLLKPVLATVVILNFIGVWNDFFVGLVFINQESQKTLQLGITRFQSSFSVRYAYLLSAIIISVLPSAFVYALMQDKIIDGISTGAVKG